MPLSPSDSLPTRDAIPSRRRAAVILSPSRCQAVAEWPLLAYFVEKPPLEAGAVGVGGEDWRREGNELRQFP
jgi:hypothetical protein